MALPAHASGGRGCEPSAVPVAPVKYTAALFLAEVEAAGFVWLEECWQGWNTKQRFRCRAGHVVHLYPSYVRRAGLFCRQCRNVDLLQRLAKKAEAQGVKCLDAQWLGAQAQYRFKCGCGQEWHHDPSLVSCPRCSRETNRARRRLTDGLERLRKAAQEHGGECLSEQYLGWSGKARFRCAKGYQWETAAAEVLRGAWCGHCALERAGRALRRPDGLQALQRAAEARGGSCLADEYQGVAQRYLFRCAEGHEWVAQGTRILRGAWCPPCAARALSQRRRAKDGIQRLQEVARQRGGVCLNEIYLGGSQRYTFRCTNGHQWNALGSSVLGGSWCLQCTRDQRRLGIDAAKETAKARGGLCLSDRYVNSHTKMTWECDRGHVWQTCFSVVRRGAWCPQCAHLTQITNAKSKARRRYQTAGTLDHAQGLPAR